MEYFVALIIFSINSNLLILKILQNSIVSISFTSFGIIIKS